jgi:hypothetical protein
MSWQPVLPRSPDTPQEFRLTGSESVLEDAKARLAGRSVDDRVGEDRAGEAVRAETFGVGRMNPADLLPTDRTSPE